MKDSLFVLLMNLFERTLTKIKENIEPEADAAVDDLSEATVKKQAEMEFLQSAQNDSMRVLNYSEQVKLTKASYQFLMRMLTWEIIHPNVFEMVINQLLFSESRYVTLLETKSAIRDTLAENLDAEQLAFLDLILYQKEDNVTLH